MFAAQMHKSRGATLILIAIAITLLFILIALVLDASRLYVTRQYLVNSCDAAALAGGMELPNQAKSSQKAGQCAVSNRMTAYQISFPADGMTASGPTKIRVDGQLTVQYGFARVLGHLSRVVHAYAIVKKTDSIGWVNANVVPWGIPFYGTNGQPYTYGTGMLYTLKVGSQKDLQDGLPGKVGGNFYALALERSLGDGGSGGNVYRDCIKYGFDGMVRVGDVTDTEPGNMVGPTKQGVDYRIDQANVMPWADDAWNNLDYGNPRVIIVPIVSPLGHGRSTVTILGFAAFYLEEFKGQEAKGRFLSYTIPDAGGSGSYYGVSNYQLIE
jgi:hypothetical protein